MFASVRITGGYANELLALRNKTFDLTGGQPIILFGPNGCGKSTLLNILAGYSLIPRHYSGVYRGWSQLDANLELPHNQKTFNFPELFKYRAPSSADVVWDGSATFFYNSEASDKGIYDVSEMGENSPDGMTSITDYMSAMRKSSGEKRLMKLYRLKERLQNIPDLLDLTNEQRGQLKAPQEAIYQYLSDLPQLYRATVLLDEPDKSLSLINQIHFWGTFIPSMSRLFQVIIATHCPLVVLTRHRYRIIDLSPGYLDACTNAIGGLITMGGSLGIP